MLFHKEKDGDLMADKRSNRYEAILEHVFFDNYEQGNDEVNFERDDLVKAASSLNIDLPKNLGDVIYSTRYRTSLPSSICELAPEGKEWIIRGRGRAKYAFCLAGTFRIKPNEMLLTTKIPDATPEIIRAAAQTDEQALLAVIRYNRLIDIFLGVAAYSLQNHLITTVEEIGQVEIDEIYVAVDSAGQQYIIPVQAKGHNDEIGVTQPEQDLAVCSSKWPSFTSRSIAVQFMDDGVVALFLLVMNDGEIRVAKEAHYELVPYAEITDEDRSLYRQAENI